jgi:hypothetical protein
LKFVTPGPRLEGRAKKPHETRDFVQPFQRGPRSRNLVPWTFSTKGRLTMTDAMNDTKPQPTHSFDERERALDVGGLHFTASFRAPGATLRIFGPVGGRQTELLRFDDFVDGPHYHVPADGPQIIFDEAELGEPLAWFVAEIRDHLEEMLVTAGFGELLPVVDTKAVAENAETIRQIMVDCVPEGFVRSPGVGLRRANG